MKNIFCLILFITKTLEKPMKSDLEETITTGGHAINLLKERGRSLRLSHRTSPFVSVGDLKNPPGTYPWEVSIGLVDQSVKGKWQHYCGGIIVSNVHIITSANCLEFMVKSEYVGCNVTDIHIRAGDHDLKMVNEITYIQEIRIKNYEVHPEFEKMEHTNEHYKNIAVIELEEQLTFEDVYVRPIDLPTLEEAETITKEANTGISLVVAGWGFWTSKNRKRHAPGKALRDGVIASFSDVYCDSIYNGTRLSKGFTDDIMCGASPLNLAGICCGDDGSGVFKLDHQKQRFVLTGILSLGTNWNEDGIFCGNKTKPNIFVRVASKRIIHFLYEKIYGIPFVRDKNEVSTVPSNNGVSQYIYGDCLNKAIDDGYNGTNKTAVWPWLVSLRTEKEDPDDDYSLKWKHFCGGTILSNTKILTAAHCTTGIEQSRNPIKLRAGDVLLTNSIDDEDVQEVVVKNITLHPKYSRHTHRDFDLAILDLEIPLSFSKSVRPVCLLSLQEALHITKAEESYLALVGAGWGNKGEALEHTVATIFSEETCNRTHQDEHDYKNLVPNLFSEDTLCAGDISGEAGSCTGDSGSGAVHFDEHRQRFVLRAVVSGSAHQYCGTFYYPNVYVRMANKDIMEWIFHEIDFFPTDSVTLKNEGMIVDNSGKAVFKFVCIASPSRPESSIKWIITDENNNHVAYDDKPLESISETEKGFTKSSSLVVAISSKLKMQCQAENVVGKQISNTLINAGYKQTGSFTLDGGSQGSWGSPQYCTFPHFVNKMRLKFQGDVWGDDSALNGIQLTCTDGSAIYASIGSYGSWRATTTCSSGSFIKSAKIRADKASSNDNTAANGIRFKCTDGVEHVPGDGYWGFWTSWHSCPQGSHIYGLQTQIDNGGKDITGLNDVTFIVRNFKEKCDSQTVTANPQKIVPWSVQMVILL